MLNYMQRLVKFSKRNLNDLSIAPINNKNKWESIIGLEVHAQIASKTKLFSGSSTVYGAPLNTSVSNFDAAIPGTLPVLNRKCVEAAVRTALALNCKVNNVSMFDRKHYFYADLPAGYQITQQRAALANNGEITFPVLISGKQKSYQKTVRLLQLQLEQDSGKSLHDDQLKRSLVDLNRAGIPLMELVFAPDLKNGEEAAFLIKELILILKRLESCSCKMEEGCLRVDANVSIHKENEELGTRTEIKNINSISNISQAITYEIQRQIDVVNNGGVIKNETRFWDAESRRTLPMRDKEVVQDYRFMPEPNLPPLVLNVNNSIFVSDLKANLPDLPEHTRKNLISEFNLNQELAIILVNEPVLLSHFNAIVKSLPEIPSKQVANFLINDFLAFCNKINISQEDCKVSDKSLIEILRLLHKNVINLHSARVLISHLHFNPDELVNQVIKEKQMEQITDLIEIEKYCKIAIENNPKAVSHYKSGKKKVFYAIVGDVAKLTNQRASMKIVVQKLEDLLK